MRLSKLLADELVLFDMAASTKEGAIDALLTMIGKRFPQLDKNQIADAVAERERVENTSYGHGYAFPHARTDAVERMYIAIGISKKGLADKTADGQQLCVVCLMLTPSNISQLYLQTLSAFARFAREPKNLKRLLEAKNPASVVDVIHNSGVTVDRELLVRDIMVEKVISVTPTQTVKEIANLFYRHRIGAMPVIDSGCRIVGQISNGDLISAALDRRKKLMNDRQESQEYTPFDDLLKVAETETASNIMRPEKTSTTEDTPVVDLAAMMVAKNLRMVPVVREEKLVGVVVISDIVSKIIRG